MRGEKRLALIYFLRKKKENVFGLKKKKKMSPLTPWK